MKPVEQISPHMASVMATAGQADRCSFWVEYRDGKTPSSTKIHPDFLGQLRGSLAVLDLGCASGNKARIFDGLGHRVVGVDINSAELVLGNETRDDRNRVGYVQGDGCALPLGNAGFDCVVLSGTLGGVDSVLRQGIVAESYRVLKPGGQIYISEFMMVDDKDWVEVYKSHCKFTGEFGSVVVTDWEKERVRFIGHHFSQDELNRMLSQNGFSNFEHRVELVMSEVGGRLHPDLSIWAEKR